MQHLSNPLFCTKAVVTEMMHTDKCLVFTVKSSASFSFYTNGWGLFSLTEKEIH